MAESGGQEKTEKPTAKKRRDARKEGNVFQSRDVATVVVLLGVFFTISMLISFIYETIGAYAIGIWGGVGSAAETGIDAEEFTKFVYSFAVCALPLLLVSIVLAIVATGAQTRFLMNFKSVKPKLSKLNPINGIKRLFSMKNVVELLKNLLKFAILLVLLYNEMKDTLSKTSRMIDMTPMNSAILMLNMIFDLVKTICLAFAVVAFFDYLYQRWRYEKDLMMTKEEVKEEYKMTEGNPEIKGRIKKLQRQMANTRMMQKVPTADVIIRNPTHFAVALKYEPKKHGAPIVVAMGQDELALRIVRVAEEHHVPTIENKPLARALFAECELDREIPAEYYGVVAEILVYIFKESNRMDMFK